MGRVHIKDITIRDVRVPNWMTRQPTVDHLVPPVIIHIGNPIVNIPGCVKAHQDNQFHVTGLPKDRNLVNQDSDRAMIVCDAEVPSYDAMNYEPEQLIITREAPVPPVAPPPVPETEVPSTGDLKVEKDPDCPGPGNLRVGDTTQSGDERVVGHQLIQDPVNPAKKICETLYEPTSVLEKYLPPPNQAATVTALAVVATAGAAATPLLIRIIRPAVKKLWTTIQKKLGKNVRELSKSEIQTNKYREKKGLPPIKRK
tara:strand:+ start:732 stop:1499 length:768 start_codon:yes stop_codon:yes gene_type:complete